MQVCIIRANIAQLYKILINMICSRPLIIGFMGLPGVGKTTLAKKISHYFVDVPCFFECEEAKYPEHIKQKFSNRDQFGYFDIYNYFRDMRSENLTKADVRKKQGQSTILDCYFDKLLYPLFKKKSIDWFVNSKHPDYARILGISKKDSECLEDIDVLIFLSANEGLYKALLKMRGRKSEVDASIHCSQADFLKISKDYAETHQIPFFVIDQELGVEKVAKKILNALEFSGLICAQ